MKPQLVITSIVLTLLSSCAPLGVYTKRHLRSEAASARVRGIQEGRQQEVRRSQIQRELELSKPQPKSEYYELPVPAHTTSDGVLIAPHHSNFQIYTH